MVSVETFSACCVQGVGQWIGLQPGRSLKPRYAVSAMPMCLDDADEASSILKGAQLLSSRLQSSTELGARTAASHAWITPRLACVFCASQSVVLRATTMHQSSRAAR